MATNKYISVSIVCLALSSCSMAEHYNPVVDMKGAKGDYYSALAECRGYASQVDVIEDSLTGVAAGGLSGAAFGSALGAISGRAGAGAATGAVLGGGIGGGSVWSSAQGRQIHIINKCLERRGFTVLG